jgi:DNA-binding GntR family transcriptional regulator
MAAGNQPQGQATRPVLVKPRDRSRQAAPQVSDVLRARILSLDLVPGTVLSRVDLQAEFGLSSTPIREALLLLAGEGLVDIFPQHATLVAPIDLTQAQQTQFLRRSIELEIVRHLALSQDRAFLAALEESLKEQEFIASRKDLDRFMAADLAFHRQMYEAAGVPDLWPMLRRQTGHVDRIRRLHLPSAGKVEQILADHTALVKAIAARNAPEAQEVLRGHLSRSLSLTGEMRVQHPDYFRD